MTSCLEEVQRAPDSIPLVNFQTNCVIVLQSDDQLGILTQKRCDHGRRLIADAQPDRFGGGGSSAAISAKSASRDTIAKPFAFA
jgi:hypothetical protein